MSAGIFASSTSSTTLCSRFSSHYTTTRTATHGTNTSRAACPACATACTAPAVPTAAGAPLTPATLPRCSCCRRLAARAAGGPLGRQIDRHRQRAMRRRAAGRRRRRRTAVAAAAASTQGHEGARRHWGQGTRSAAARGQRRGQRAAAAAGARPCRARSVLCMCRATYVPCGEPVDSGTSVVRGGRAGVGRTTTAGHFAYGWC